MCSVGFTSRVCSLQYTLCNEDWKAEWHDVTLSAFE